MRNTIFAFILGLTSQISFSCPDFTGAYEVHENGEYGEHLAMTIAQQGCESLENDVNAGWGFSFVFDGLPHSHMEGDREVVMTSNIFDSSFTSTIRMDDGVIVDTFAALATGDIDEDFRAYDLDGTLALASARHWLKVARQASKISMPK